MIPVDELRRALTPTHPLRRFNIEARLDRTLEFIEGKITVERSKPLPITELIGSNFTDLPICYPQEFRKDGSSSLQEFSTLWDRGSPFYVVHKEVTFCAGRADYAVMKVDPGTGESDIKLVIEMGDNDPEKLYFFARFAPDYDMWHFPYDSQYFYTYSIKRAEEMRK